jgi:hypothetical protein
MRSWCLCPCHSVPPRAATAPTACSRLCTCPIAPAAAAGTPLGALPKGLQVEFDAPSYSLSFADQGPFRSSLLRVRYSSLTQPSSTYDVNMGTGALPGRWRQFSL